MIVKFKEEAGKAAKRISIRPVDCKTKDDGLIQEKSA